MLSKVKQSPVKAKTDYVRADVFAARPRQHLAQRLRSHFALRFHSTVLMMLTFSVGLLTTKGLLALGMHSMFWRYTIALVVAYGVFFLGVRLWLAYVGIGTSEQRRDSSNSGLDRLDAPFTGGGSPGGGSVDGAFSGGGGTYSGSGASASFDAAPTSAPEWLALDNANLATSSVDSGSSSSILDSVGGNVGDVDVGDAGDGCAIVLVVVLVIGLIALLIGGAVFIVTIGPEVLIDAAFSALLSGGLLKSGKRVAEPGWMGSVFKGTWKPLLGVLVLTWSFVGMAAKITPGAHTFAEVTRVLWMQLVQTP
jgi:hypothetical protein